MTKFGTSEEFIVADEMEWEVVGEGVKRKIMGYDDNIMLVQVSFEEGSIGYKHEHYHSQTSWVASGEFLVSIGDEEKLLKTGDCFFIPPNKIHGAVCQKKGVLIDVFSPIREDFMV